MKVIIHNNKYEDEIVFEVDELSEESRKDVLSRVRSRGWEDKDCWSEVVQWLQSEVKEMQPIGRKDIYDKNIHKWPDNWNY